jgi:hypothetical protein
VLPEFIAVRIPTRDRDGNLLPAALRDEWIHQIKRCLLHDLDIVGLEEDQVVGLWRGEYDPETDEFGTVSEECLIVRAYCTEAQLRKFSVQGEELLLHMVKALQQEAVAYETREGLIILYSAVKGGKEHGI